MLILLDGSTTKDKCEFKIKSQQCLKIGYIFYNYITMIRIEILEFLQNFIFKNIDKCFIAIYIYISNTIGIKHPGKYTNEPSNFQTDSPENIYQQFVSLNLSFTSKSWSYPTSESEPLNLSTEIPILRTKIGGNFLNLIS